MTIYSINHGIGWASSGVEYAQAYRASIFKKINQTAKFVFTDFFSHANISDLTRNIGFEDEDIIWLYGYFTDIPIGPVTFTLEDLKKEYQGKLTHIESDGDQVKLFYGDENIYLTAYLQNIHEKKVHRVEIVSKGNLIRKDFYTGQKIFSEYYIPYNNVATLTNRHFYNQDGSVAYSEVINGDRSFYKFPNKLLYSKIELFDYFMENLDLQSDDIVIIDRSTNTAQSVLKHRKNAKVGVVVHAEHFAENSVTDSTILWNNFYDYQFSNAHSIDFFITATDRQKEILERQFHQYTSFKPRIITIPVGSIDHLVMSDERKPFSLITASRLAMEKHIDWLVKAVVKAHEINNQIHFDIYGYGNEQNKIESIINQKQAKDYIHLKGHHDLKDVYKNYQLYVTASKSEGFGLTLLEAVGSGLPLIGFDVRYGNQTFIENGKNGYLIPVSETDDEIEIVNRFSEKILDYFQKENQLKWQKHSYKIASGYLTSEVIKKWQLLIEEFTLRDKFI